MPQRSAKDVVEEMFRRQQAGDDTVARRSRRRGHGEPRRRPQGRDGLKLILRIIDDDLGPIDPRAAPPHRRRRPRRAAPHAARDPSGVHDAAARRRARLGSPDGVDVHPHLAGRRRDDRRALGVPRRHGPARAAARLTARRASAPYVRSGRHASRPSMVMSSRRKGVHVARCEHPPQQPRRFTFTLHDLLAVRHVAVVAAHRG